VLKRQERGSSGFRLAVGFLFLVELESRFAPSFRAGIGIERVGVGLHCHRRVEITGLGISGSECVKKFGVFPPHDFARVRCQIDSFLAVAVLGVWTGRPEPGEVVLSECVVASRCP
jgi:hypothetical protein